MCHPKDSFFNASNSSILRDASISKRLATGRTSWMVDTAKRGSSKRICSISSSSIKGRFWCFLFLSVGVRAASSISPVLSVDRVQRVAWPCQTPEYLRFFLFMFLLQKKWASFLESDFPTLSSFFALKLRDNRSHPQVVEQTGTDRGMKDDKADQSTCI